MKSAKMSTILVLALCLTVCTTELARAAPLGTAFTYQGRLMDANGPADGLYDFQFKLFDDANTVTGNQVGSTIDINDLDVIDGQFAIALDFGSDVFDGNTVWLETRVVESPLGSDPCTLTPRQEITPVPYALQTRGLFVDNVLNVGIGTTSPVGKLHVDGGKAFSGDGGTDLVFKAQDGGDAWFTDNDGSPGGDIILLPGEGGDGLGIGSPGLNGNVGIGTTSPKARLSAGGNGYINTGVYGNASNYGVYGYADNYGVYGYNSGSGNYGYLGSTNYGVYGYSSSMWGMAGSSDSGVGVRGESSSGIGLYGESSAGIGVRGVSTTFWAGFFEGPENDGTIATLVIRSGGQNMLLGGNEIDTISGDKKLYLNYNSQGNVILNANGGNVGIGTTSPQRKLHIEGGSDASLGGGGFLVTGSESGTNMVIDDNEIIARNNGNPSKLYLNKGSGNVVVSVLEIIGGSDLAEPFEVAGAESIKPGMVVAIDPEHPGQLRIADKAYDRTVAGIVSGANGINPGMIMSQEETVADGSLLVALTGRVYAWADASNGLIEPGDLLTTSETPGHAMKVTDYSKAHGAILGKAMSSLDQGQGLVLVLVTLQ